MAPFSTLPDFTVTPAMSAITIIPGQGAVINFTLTSINGFRGTVLFRTDSFPYGGSDAYFYGGVSTNLVPGGTARATLVVGYPVNRIVSQGIHVIWASFDSNCATHMAVVTVTVPSVPSNADFTVTADPASLSLQPGGSQTSTVSVTSRNGYSGTVSLAAFFEGKVGASLSRYNVTLAPGSTQTARITVNTFPNWCLGNYDVLVFASNGNVYNSHPTHATILPVEITTEPQSPLPQSRSFQFLSGLLTILNTLRPLLYGWLAAIPVIMILAIWREKRTRTRAFARDPLGCKTDYPAVC